MSKPLTLWVAVVCLIAYASASSAANEKPPHIIHILADDLGWAELGYHRDDAPGSKEVMTPNIDALVKDGLELDQHYVHTICSPSRCAIQTGRYPIHVNVQNVLPESDNPDDPDGGYAGVAMNFSTIPKVLKQAGYKSHIVGKWDVGMARPELSPKARGYDSWFGYWHHSNDYWTFLADDSHCPEGAGRKKMPDLWRQNATFDGPLPDMLNGPDCNQANQSPSGQRCVYEEKYFTDEVKNIIESHDQSDPLFLFWSMHLVHMPLQVPKPFYDKFEHIDNTNRRFMHAMVNYMDTDIGDIVKLLKDVGMWNNTLLVFHADNGGEILDSICGGNNWPLRGGKFANWQGGIRVNAFVNGGFLPEARRGHVADGLVGGWDWYSTYAGIAAVDATDHEAAAAGLPPIDSLNMWPYLSGQESVSPRQELVIGDTNSLLPNGDGKTLVGGLINGDGMKILLGAEDKLHTLNQYVRTGPSWPNSTSHIIPVIMKHVCSRDPRHGCLYNITADPNELENLSEQLPDVFHSMLDRIDEVQKTVYSPNRGKKDALACKVAEDKYDGFWGPFLHID